MAAFRRKRRHHKNQPQRIALVRMPHGEVTVSVTQYSALSSGSLPPGCQCQPDTQTVSGINSSSSAPPAVRFAISYILFFLCVNQAAV